MTTELETPATLPTPETPVDDSPKVDITQAALDKIIKSSMGRAGAEARKNAADAERKVAELQAQLATALDGSKPNATEVERLTAELLAKDLQIKSIRESADEDKKTSTLLKSIGSNGFVDNALVLQILKSDVKLGEDGRYQVIDPETGSPLINSTTGNPVTVEEHVADFAAKRPYLVRGTTKSGTGSESSSGRPPTQAVPLQRYFGPTSNSAEANRLALSNPTQYQRLKRDAQKEGLI